MADGLEFQLTGIDELEGKLKGLPIAMRAKGIRYAGRKAATVIQQAAVANAQRLDDPTTSESIAKNITTRFSNSTFKRTGDIMFRVGVQGGARQFADTRENRRKRRVGQEYATGGDKANPGGDTWYWRLLEFGTENIPAKSPLRSALENNITQATDVFVTNVNKWLDRNLKKITKKGL